MTTTVRTTPAGFSGSFAYVARVLEDGRETLRSAFGATPEDAVRRLEARDRVTLAVAAAMRLDSKEATR
jgi:hypothetical protein